MATSNYGRPGKVLVYVVVASVVLTLLTAGLIWKGTEQVLSIKSSSIGMMDGGYGVVASAPIAEQANTIMAGRSIATIMPPIPVTPGAGPEDRTMMGQKVIRNGSLTLRVDDAAKRLEEARVITEQAGGFVASANLSDNAGVKTAYATLRIPADKYRATADAIKKFASTVFDESESGQDVTDQYVDLDARLKAAQAEEAQYMEILKDARSIEDTLNVTARLGDVRSRIEQMQGQKRGLEDQTSYATLSLTMTEEARVEAPTRTWKPGETLNQAMRSLVESLQVLADSLISIAVFFVGLVLPVLIVLGILAWIVWVIIRRKSGKK